MKFSKGNIVRILLILLFAVFVKSYYSLPQIGKPSTTPVPTPVASPLDTEAEEAKGMETEPTSAIQDSTPTVLVTRVIDGDTIEIEGGQTVRYIGINTPETKDPRRGVECFGDVAYLKNKELVEGKQVILAKDVSETDRFGRLLRYVYIPTPTVQATLFINEYLIREGFANASSYPPDVRYQDLFRQAEKEARQNQKGLWAACP